MNTHQKNATLQGSFVGLKPDTVGTIIDDYWTVIRDAEHGNEKSFENQKSLIKYSFENVEGSFEVELPELSEDTAVEIIKYAVQVCLHSSGNVSQHCLSGYVDSATISR